MSTDIRERRPAVQTRPSKPRTNPRDPRTRPQSGGPGTRVDSLVAGPVEISREDRERSSRRQVQNIAAELRPMIQEMLVSVH